MLGVFAPFAAFAAFVLRSWHGVARRAVPLPVARCASTPFAPFAAFVLRSWHRGHGTPCPYRWRACASTPFAAFAAFALRSWHGGHGGAVPLPVARCASTPFAPFAAFALRSWHGVARRCRAPTGGALCVHTLCALCRLCDLCVTVLAWGGTACRAPTGGALCVHTLCALCRLCGLGVTVLAWGGTACRAPTGGAPVRQYLCALCRLCGLCVSSFAASAAFALRPWHGGHGTPCPYRWRAVRPHPLRPLRPSRYGLGMGGTARRAPTGSAPVRQYLGALCRLCGLCVSSFAASAAFVLRSWHGVARRAAPLPVARLYDHIFAPFTASAVFA
ncbi:hypothetical protein Cagg_0099 [Chloroflexus aggregans DSM 9485]|uniref:Uncharacterized protein n=1 Tax=Chloroflexus aggregans (strain MD-66 / DSM 9485) TaxID=326427 RepID=B8GC78_CHLAD|nr:hypothetical protein Cagg_0099 [Chloroflexus aggregans DSM 9485]